MSVKQFYLPPETMTLPIQPEGTLCQSTLPIIMDTALGDYDLLSAGDIDWATE